MFSMRRARKILKKYERGFMIGLIVFLLAIFTVASNLAGTLRGGRGRSGDEWAGSFAPLPGERVDVTWDDYRRARARYQLSQIARRGGRGRESVRDTEVWTYLLLRETARHEGIGVSDAELREELGRQWGVQVLQDPSLYRQILKSVPTTAAEYESCLRDWLATERVRDLYRQSFETAPPASREKLIESFQSQGSEFVRVSWASLDAGGLLGDARDALAADRDPDKALGEFFESDPEVQAEESAFITRPRWRLELLYTMHKRMLTDERYEAAEALFRKAFPEAPDLERPVREIESYAGTRLGRLLRQLGYDGVDDVDVKVPGEEEEKPKGKPEEPGGKKAEEDPDAEAAEALRRAREEEARKLVQPQAVREVKLRAMYQYLNARAAADESKSLQVLFDRLRQHDDPQDPLCSAEPGRGVFVYRELLKPLAAEDLAALEDDGEPFTFNFSARVTPEQYRAGDKVGEDPIGIGDAAQGRGIFRVLSYDEEKRKRFSELTDGEKETLRDEFYLPYRARERAREALAELRRRFIEGELEEAAFADEARKRGARFYADEWVEASGAYVAEPERHRFWHDDFLHMRDRHFLRKHLTAKLLADRREKKLQAGSWLEVAVAARSEETDPGGAYLVLLKERKPFSAETVSRQELGYAIQLAAHQRRVAERDWWSRSFELLKNRFDFELSEAMQKRIDDQLEQERRAERSPRPR
ncbi:MAG: hypothetical protein ACE5JG_05895 [Planctomycetota bacterium]